MINLRSVLRFSICLVVIMGIGASLGPMRAPLAAPAEAPSGEIPPVFFGMSLGMGAGWPPVPFGSLGKAPATTWAYLEPTKGHFNWSRLDPQLAQAQAHNVPMFYATDYVPKWAALDPSTCRMGVFNTAVCTSGPANMQDWDDFVTALATHYKGKIEMYELWNEPDMPQESTATMEQMVTLTNHMAKIIRVIDPGALIGSPSAVPEWLDRYWAAGGTRDVDIVTLHGYPGNVPAESICYFRTQPLKAVMAKYGISKPLWDTESSWGGGDVSRAFSPDQRIAFVARHYLMHWSCGVSRYYWWLWGKDWGAMLDQTGNRNEASIAYENIEHWMVGATMVHPCAAARGDKYHALYVCDFTRDGDYQGRVVWHTDGNASYQAPNQFLHYRDLEGGQFDVPANHQVPIGIKPILLENR